MVQLVRRRRREPSQGKPITAEPGPVASTSTRCFLSCTRVSTASCWQSWGQRDNLVFLSMFCLVCSYINLLDGIDWVAAAPETSFHLACAGPMGRVSPHGATSSFTESLQPVDASLSGPGSPSSSSLRNLAGHSSARHWHMDSTLILLVAVHH